MAESVVINETPPGNDQEHIDKMVALADGVPTPEIDSRPEWLPEKFKTAEEMANAYKSLESKLGVKEPEAAVVAPVPETPLDLDDTAAVEKELSSKGLDLSKYAAEFAATGSITEISYQELVDGGYPRELIDNYISGQEAKRSAYDTSVKASIGGSDEFDSMVSWASTNASAGDLESYNKAIASGDPSAARLAVKGMYAQYKDSRGTEPNLLTGANGTAAGDLYESVQQMTTDMKNPAYKTDPAFRRKVEAKISRSSIF
jgi:hypothetical protein